MSSRPEHVVGLSVSKEDRCLVLVNDQLGPGLNRLDRIPVDDVVRPSTKPFDDLRHFLGSSYDYILSSIVGKFESVHSLGGCENICLCFLEFSVVNSVLQCLDR